jgi:divalent metal cation (Fe/Co/Zn/Cd) transporter
MLLFSVGGAFSVYEGIHKLMVPEPLERPWIAIGVLVVSVVLEWLSLRACMQEVDKVREGRSTWAWFRESRNAELIVIYGEQLAALLGLVVALAAVVLALVTGNPMYDAIGTLGIGVLLIVVALFVAYEVKGLLIGQSVAPDRREAIRAWLAARPEILEIFNVITLQLGQDVLVAVQARLDGNLRADALVATINAIEVELRRTFPDVKWSFFEPDDSP